MLVSLQALASQPRSSGWLSQPRGHWQQRWIFIFGAVGFFKSGAFWKFGDSWCHTTRLHVLVTFTEQVVPIHKHITLFWIPSISGTKTVTMKLTKKAAVKLSDYTSITYLLSTSLASCKLKNGFRRFVSHIIAYVTITDFQRHEKRMLIVIHFNPSRSFFYSRVLSTFFYHASLKVLVLCFKTPWLYVSCKSKCIVWSVDWSNFHCCTALKGSPPWKFVGTPRLRIRTTVL